jgi:hypothetical protein
MLQALGHLAVVTAQIEELLHQIYWKHAGLTEKTGPIVTDNINPKRLMEDALKFTGLDPSRSNVHEDLALIFKEFEDINTKRNHCLHWVWETVESKPTQLEMDAGLLFGYRPPPAYQVKRPIYKLKGVETQPFSTADIQQLCNDSSWLIQRFRSHTLSEGELRRRRSEYENLPVVAQPPGSEIKTFADLFWPAPWLDKSAPPNPTPSGCPGTQK